MDLSDLDTLAPDEARLVLRVSEELNSAGLDYVLAVGHAGDGHVTSNMCPHCAVKLLGGALAGALAKVEREARHNSHETLQ
jgi:hypothetical protein